MLCLFFVPCLELTAISLAQIMRLKPRLVKFVLPLVVITILIMNSDLWVFLIIFLFSKVPTNQIKSREAKVKNF